MYDDNQLDQLENNRKEWSKRKITDKERQELSSLTKAQFLDDCNLPPETPITPNLPEFESAMRRKYGRFSSTLKTPSKRKQLTLVNPTLWEDASVLDMCLDDIDVRTRFFNILESAIQLMSVDHMYTNNASKSIVKVGNILTLYETLVEFNMDTLQEFGYTLSSARRYFKAIKILNPYIIRFLRQEGYNHLLGCSNANYNTATNLASKIKSTR